MLLEWCSYLIVPYKFSQAYLSWYAVPSFIETCEHGNHIVLLCTTSYQIRRHDKTRHYIKSDDTTKHDITSNKTTRQNMTLYQIKRHDITSNQTTRHNTTLYQIRRHDITSNQTTRHNTTLYQIRRHDITCHYIESNQTTRRNTTTGTLIYVDTWNLIQKERRQQQKYVRFTSVTVFRNVS